MPLDTMAITRLSAYLPVHLSQNRCQIGGSVLRAGVMRYVTACTLLLLLLLLRRRLPLTLTVYRQILTTVRWCDLLKKKKKKKTVARMNRFFVSLLSFFLSASSSSSS